MVADGVSVEGARQSAASTSGLGDEGDHRGGKHGVAPTIIREVVQRTNERTVNIMQLHILECSNYPNGSFHTHDSFTLILTLWSQKLGFLDFRNSPILSNIDYDKYVRGPLKSGETQLSNGTPLA